MDISIIDENTDGLWSELNLSSLLRGNDNNGNMLSLQQQIGLIELKNRQDPLMKKHIKKWKKPAYNVLKERLIIIFMLLLLILMIITLYRYNAKPIIPPKIHRSKIEKLADPIRGKYR